MLCSWPTLASNTLGRAGGWQSFLPARAAWAGQEPACGWAGPPRSHPCSLLPFLCGDVCLLAFLPPALPRPVPSPRPPPVSPGAASLRVGCPEAQGLPLEPGRGRCCAQSPVLGRESGWTRGLQLESWSGLRPWVGRTRQQKRKCGTWGSEGERWHHRRALTCPASFFVCTMGSWCGLRAQPPWDGWGTPMSLRLWSGLPFPLLSAQSSPSRQPTPSALKPGPGPPRPSRWPASRPPPSSWLSPPWTTGLGRGLQVRSAP